MTRSCVMLMLKKMRRDIEGPGGNVSEDELYLLLLGSNSKSNTWCSYSNNLQCAAVEHVFCQVKVKYTIEVVGDNNMLEKSLESSRLIYAHGSMLTVTGSEGGAF